MRREDRIRIELDRQDACRLAARQLRHYAGLHQVVAPILPPELQYVLYSAAVILDAAVARPVDPLMRNAVNDLIRTAGALANPPIRRGMVLGPIAGHTHRRPAE